MTEPTVDVRSVAGPGADPDDGVVPTPIRILNGVCVGLACVMLAIIECLLVPLRAGPVPIPVSFGLVVAGNLLLPVVMRTVTQMPMTAVVPAGVWLVVALIAGTRTSEGDLIVTGQTYDLAFLIVGALAAALGARAVRHKWPWSFGQSGGSIRGQSGARR